MASLNSGIGVSQIIIDSLADDSINAMEVKISHESFVLGKTSNVEKRWSSLVKEIQSWLSPNEPSFILLKSGHPNTSFKWTLIQFIPDTSSVREKMIYSSSKALLVKELHQDQLFQIFATQVKEVTSAGLDEFAISSEAPNPLSDKEKEKQIHQYEEVRVSTMFSEFILNLLM
jgi:twinfilin-like protein